jgi:hypothetical protein
MPVTLSFFELLYLSIIVKQELPLVFYMSLDKKKIILNHLRYLVFSYVIILKGAILTCFVLLIYKIWSINPVLLLSYYVIFLFFLTVYKYLLSHIDAQTITLYDLKCYT